MIFRFGHQCFDLTERVLVMGILNVTPDSFSDGGLNFAPEDAIASGRQMIAEGAEILDIGGESTRPGAPPVSTDEEAGRVVPVIGALRRETGIPISVDTVKSEVARAALEAGADIVNDVSGCYRDPQMKHVVATTGCGVVVMHMRGTPETMQQFTVYGDLLDDINDYFGASIAMLVQAGVQPECIVLDPGIGFSKTAEQNLTLINRLDAFARHGRPVLLGPSRKSFIGKMLNLAAPADREWGTAAAVSCGVLRGARIIRVHNVAAMRQVAALAQLIAHA